MRLSRTDSKEERQKYHVVRRDTFLPIPGEILEANTEDGKVVVYAKVGNPSTNTIEDKEISYDLGPNGISILPNKTY